MRSNQNPNPETRFHNLTYQDQLDAVWQQGQLLITRQIPGFWLHLYAVNTFFVEIWICQRTYTVTLLRVLNQPNDLEPYLYHVQLSLHELLP